MPRQSFLQGCVCVVLTAIALPSSIWVEVVGTSNGCIIVQSAPAATRLIWSQLRQRSVCCNKLQPDCLHTPTGSTHWATLVWSLQLFILIETHGKRSCLFSTPGHPHRTRRGGRRKGGGGGLFFIWERKEREKGRPLAHLFMQVVRRVKV